MEVESKNNRQSSEMVPLSLVIFTRGAVHRSYRLRSEYSLQA